MKKLIYCLLSLFLVSTIKSIKFENRSNKMIALILKNNNTSIKPVILLKGMKYKQEHIESCLISIEGDAFLRMEDLSDSDSILFLENKPFGFMILKKEQLKYGLIILHHKSLSKSSLSKASL